MSSDVVPSSPALTARADANCWERLWQFDTLGFHDDIITQSSSQCIPVRALLGFRVAVALFFIGHFIWIPIYYDWAKDMNRDASYLTHWTLAVVTFYFILSSMIMLFSSGPSSPMRFFGQLCLLTAETAISFSGVVVTVYWLLLYKPGMYTTNYQFYFNIVYHALTMVFMLIDFFLGRITFVWRHYWYCIIYGLVYMIINLIYSLSTGLPIYSILTWKSWMSAAVVVGVFIYVAFLFGLFMLLARVRDRFRPVADFNKFENSGATATEQVPALELQALP